MDVSWTHGDWRISVDAAQESEPRIIRDVEVSNVAGERWWGSAATIEQILGRLDHYSTSGECAGGAYFWAAGLVVIRDQSDETLKAALHDLIDTGDYQAALVRISDDVA